MCNSAHVVDVFDAERGDLDVYVAIARELGARRVVDVGCGTGTLAVMLAAEGFAVTALDPARASVDIARGKPGAERVRWIVGDASVLPRIEADLATMTGNVAQAIADPAAWEASLGSVYEALRPGGHFVLETRDPSSQGWREWTRDQSHRRVDIDGVEPVQSWVELTEVALPMVSFTTTFVFHADAAVVTSDSTLRFRDRGELEYQLTAAGYCVEEVRDAPDRPGREFVFFARRPG